MSLNWGIWTDLPADGRLLFATRMLRLFAYGGLSVVLALYLAEIGFSETGIGLLLSLTLLGDTAISLWLSTRADRWGRRRVLMLGALLMALSGAVFSSADQFWLLLPAATLGVISPSGNEVGPFLPIEQAALAEVVSDRRRTRVFGWYALAGSLATALGALASGLSVEAARQAGWSELASFRLVTSGYALLGLALAVLFGRLTKAAEVSHARGHASDPAAGGLLGLGRSQRIVLRLSALFSLDAFAGGFVVQSVMAYWFHLRFGADPASLGAIFFGANILAGFSALVAARMAARFGLVNTMVFTHLPSNILLIAAPLMPSLSWATALILLRFSISQMDVPTRQSYVMAVVAPKERSAAGGVTGVARTTGAAISPFFASLMLGSPALLNFPFFLAGSLKIAYDLLLYRSFIALPPPEESGRPNDHG